MKNIFSVRVEVGGFESVCCFVLPLTSKLKKKILSFQIHEETVTLRKLTR